MKKNIPIFCFLCMVLFSCSVNNQEFVQVIEIDVKSENIESLQNRAVIEEIIPLDNHQPIGQTRKILFYKNNFFLLDKSTNEVLCFDKTGTYLFKISNQGKGPEEYIFIQNFFIDGYNHQINIISGDGKIFSYSADTGKLLQIQPDITGSLSVIDAAQISENTKAIYGLGPDFNLYISENENPNANKYIPFNEIRDMTFSDKAFSDNKKGILFCHGTNDSIYSIDKSGNKITPRYYIDFLQYKIDPDLYFTNPKAVEAKYEKNVIATKLDDLNESNDFLLFSYLLFNPKNPMEAKKQFAIYDKNKKEVLNLQDDYCLFPVSDISGKNSFLSLVFPSQIILSKHKNRTTEMLSKYITENEINENSNPLIIKWTIE